MRILIVSQWFDPEPTFKGLAFAKALRDLGHEVEVLTGFPNYPSGKLYPGYRIRPWKREVLDGIPVLRVALWPSHSRSKLGRMANYGSYATTASAAALGLKRPDVAYVYHPPGTAALPAMALRALRGVPFVLDVQDLWPDTLAGSSMLADGSRLARAASAMMRAIYRRAAHIAVLSPGFKAKLAERGVPAEKISVIPNWTYEDESPPPPLGARQQWFGDAGFVVLFAGNMGAAQGLDVVLDAAGRLAASAPDVLFALLGGGIDVERLRGEAARRGLSNVRFLDRCSPAEAAQRTALADALLVHLRDDPLFAITIPSKTQAYLRIGRPVLMGVRGDAAGMVAEAGAGLAFEPENPEALAAAVLDLKSRPQAERDAMGASGARYYAERLAMRVGVAAIEQVLERACAGSRPRSSSSEVRPC
jgi:glycosyltransferase involved in cell wall biosynthesis